MLITDKHQREQGSVAGLQVQQWAESLTGPAERPSVVPRGLLFGLGVALAILFVAFAAGVLGSNPPVLAQSEPEEYRDVPSCDEKWFRFQSCDDYVHRPAIESLSADGVVDGTECGEQLFCPEQAITRWEVAVWLVRVVDGSDPAGTTSPFRDIPQSQWWARHVGRLFELGITKGCAVGRFCPDEPVTRAQMASFLVRAFHLQAGSNVRFDDVSSRHPHGSDIRALAANQVTVGCAINRFCPDAVTTRAQMATFLYRARNVDLNAYRISYHSEWGGSIWTGSPYTTDPQDLASRTSISDNQIAGEDECLGDFCSNQYWADYDPSWSPDGTRIAFASTRPSDEISNLYVMSHTGSQVTQLTQGGSRIQNPSWSPNGTQIAFVHHSGQTPYIYVVTLDSNDIRRLTEGGSPAWSPDGTQIAFDRDNQIYLIQPDGANQRQLTRFTGHEPAQNPAWSPDGTQIAFDRDNQIYLIQPDGANQRQLTRFTSYQSAQNPAWSPDGTRIAYESDHLFLNPYSFQSIFSWQASQGLVVMDADGSNHFRIANNARSPSWSPGSP